MIHSQDIAPSLPAERPLTWAITFGGSNAMDNLSRLATAGRKSRLTGSGHVALTRQRLSRSAAKDCITQPCRGEHHIRPLQTTDPKVIRRHAGSPGTETRGQPGRGAVRTGHKIGILQTFAIPGRRCGPAEIVRATATADQLVIAAS